MAKLFSVEIVTPRGRVFSDDVIHVRAPGVDGDFGVLADHAPLMAALRPGRLRLDDPDESFDFVLTGGFFEIHGNRAVILAEQCMRKDDIDIHRARAARDRALKMLGDAVTDDEREIARGALEKAMAIIRFAED